jgi:hypothetical protein
MKSRFPFGSTVNPAASVKLDAAQREVESWQPAGWKPGDKGGVFRGTLADLAKKHDVTGSALRGRLRRFSLPRPSDVEGGESPDPGETVKDSTPAAGGDPRREAGAEVITVKEPGAEITCKVQVIRVLCRKGTSKGVFHAQEAYRMAPSTGTESQQGNASHLQQYNPRQASELSNLAQAEHDAEVAQLVRDSIGAFRKGKSKGPNNRRIIPIAKVGDLQVLDTLFRRATGQTKGDGPTRGNLIQVNVLNRISRETVRPEAEGTSQVVELKTVTSKS